jgi:hypothetical protein
LPSGEQGHKGGFATFVQHPHLLLAGKIEVAWRDWHQAGADSVWSGNRGHLETASGGRVTNGELVTVKSVRADGGVELTDGRVLDKSFREFLPGYAVTSYGSQGKTVDYVLFSDSTVKPATNAQQWYVTISRGRRGIRIFTPDKQQLRENIIRSGHRPLAMEFAVGSVPRGQHLLWNRLHGYGSLTPSM